MTPYFASVYVKQQMRLDPELRDAVRVEVYEGGHMFYTHAGPARAFTPTRAHCSNRRAPGSAEPTRRRRLARQPPPCPDSVSRAGGRPGGPRVTMRTLLTLS